MKHQVIPIILFGLFSSATFAESPDAQFCDSILTLGYENYNNQVDNQLFQSFQSAICYSKETFTYATENNKLGGYVDLFGLIDIHGEGSGNAINSDELYIKFCKESDFESINRARFKSESRKISGSMTKAWESCKVNHLASWQNKFGTIIGVKIQPNFKEFTVNVNARVASGDIAIDSISPSSVNCFDGDNLISEFPYDTNEKNSFLLNCKKQADHNISFSISTSAGPSNSVEVTGEAPIYLELQKAIYKLELILNEQSQKIAKIESKKIELKDCQYPETNLRPEYDMGGQSRDRLWNNFDGARWHEQSCPTGQVVVGWESSHHNNSEDRASRFKCCTVAYL